MTSRTKNLMTTPDDENFWFEEIDAANLFDEPDLTDDGEDE